MKKIIIGALIAAALVLIPTQVKASTSNTGNQYMSYCKPDNSHGEEMWCLGYTQAIDHTATMLSLMVGKEYFCPNGSYTVGQTRDIIRRYLYIYPAKRSDVMMSIYIDAMQEAFPCK